MIIPGFSDYDITEDGVVTKISNGKEIKQSVVAIRQAKENYKRVCLKSDKGDIRMHNVLALLAIAYLGESNGRVARAIDGNNLNTTLSNVEWISRSDLQAESWQRGAATRKPRKRCYDEDSINMVYDAMSAYDMPVRMADLSADLQVPYTVVRYSMQALRDQGKVRKTSLGFEVIK